MNDISEAERAQLEEWSLAVVDEVFSAGYVVPPWRPSLAMHESLAGYFSAGLTPAEGAEALFATRQ